MPRRVLGKNGEVKVLPGDSVSQIASDLFDLPAAKTTHLWQNFKRPISDNSGHVIGFKDIPNVNLVYAGEVLYYKADNSAISFPEALIEATPWVQMRFRLFLDFAKASVKVVEGTTFHGRLFVKFSDQPGAFFAWDWFNTIAIGIAISFKFDFLDAGSIVSKWSTPVEFNHNEFDPRNYWKTVNPVLSFSLADVQLMSGIQLGIKFAFPTRNNFIRKNDSKAGNVSSVLKKLEIAGKDAVSPVPSISSTHAISLNLEGFRELSKKDSRALE